MRILKIDERANFLHLVPEIEDDLWHLERVIERNDIVTGLSDRKIKPKEPGEKAERVKMLVSLEVESVEFHRFLGQLRVSGRIVEGKPAELLEMGAQHSLEVELGKDVKIKKQALKKYQLERLRKAAEATKKGLVLLVVMDDEQANLALLREFELEEKATVRSQKSGKQFKASGGEEGKYFKQLLDKIVEAKVEKIVVAGPGFARENFERFLKERGKPEKMQFFFAPSNSVGKTGFQELLKGDALNKIVQEMQVLRETQLVESVLAEIGKGSGLAEYGLEQVGKAVEIGAVEKLAVADSFLLENRERAEKVMEKAEQMKAEVHLVNAGHDAGRQLENLGGIAAILRYRIL